MECLELLLLFVVVVAEAHGVSGAAVAPGGQDQGP